MLPWCLMFLFHITDVSPPTFGVTCPASPLQVFAERGLFLAQASWNEPFATDNSGVPSTVTSNHQPPKRFRQGTHVIMYTAEDQSGNKAACNFTIEVIGNTIYLYICIFIYLCIYLFIYLFIYLYIYLCIYLCIYLFMYFKICIPEGYTGVRTKGHNIPYEAQPPTRHQLSKRVYI